MSLDKQKCRKSITGNKTKLTKYVKNLPKVIILLKTKGLKRSKSVQKGSKSYGRVLIQFKKLYLHMDGL